MRRDALRSLVVYESVSTAEGEQLVDLASAERYLLPAAHPFFSPTSSPALRRVSDHESTPTSSFLRADVSPAELRLLRDLGAIELEDADVFARWLLPNFGSHPLERQVAMRAHLLRRWPSFKTHTALVHALKDENWVPVGSKLDAPSNVLDPRNSTLAFVFGGEERFPAAECAGEEWLAMLGELGMKCAVDRDAFIQCARRVEQLGVLAAGAPPSPDTVARAEMLARHLAEHLTALTAEPNEEGDNDVCLRSLLRRDQGLALPPRARPRRGGAAARRHAAAVRVRGGGSPPGPAAAVDGGAAPPPRAHAAAHALGRPRCAPAATARARAAPRAEDHRGGARRVAL